ncbi:MAG TPA: RNA polymerase recycling motor HelD [Clostridia bacterium]|nr:RNA polymerase recycling motor HelD [Clostridia bacterium]
MPIEHSDAPQEQRHLQSALQHIVAETSLLELDTEQAAEDAKRKRIESGGAFSDELAVAELIYAHRAQSLHNLHLARKQPYFTRVDFIPDDENNAKTYYIGKWGVIRAATLEQVVIDWRAPVANLYYSGQIGPMHYQAPDGEIRGELTLKRQLTVEDGELKSIFDTDVVSKDVYLQSVLGEISSDRLREVVSTIQVEQNDVIRFSADRPLVVQGVAGSGKTTIALHRIAYLLYARRDKLLPQHMMILAPNPIFLDYISAVLPDLGVDQVVQTTFSMLMSSVLGKAMPRLEAADRLEEMLADTPETREAKARLLRFQGSLRFRAILQAFVEDLERRIVPEGELRFGPVSLYTHEQLQHIFLVELKPFPFLRRMEEIPKYLKKSLRPALERVIAWLENECARRADQLLDSLPDGPERRSRMIALYDSRDQRVKEAKESAKAYVKQAMTAWPKLDLLEVYRMFWESAEKLPLQESERPLFDELASQILPLLEKKRARIGDLAPLCFLHRHIAGLPRLNNRHVVIDEAQDFSPFQFQMLRDLVGHDSFTIVGDLMQGVHAYQGLQNWQEILQPVFGRDAELKRLQTSYRNTVEIMHYASRVPSVLPTPGQVLAKPVLRHGPEPLLRACSPGEWMDALVRQVESLRAEGFHSIAILERTAARSKALFQDLPKNLHARLLQAEDVSYAGGILVAPAALIKGLEFDAVIMADVSASQFPKDTLHARLLYVCLTRPLHRLVCLWKGELSPLLTEESLPSARIS